MVVWSGNYSLMDPDTPDHRIGLLASRRYDAGGDAHGPEIVVSEPIPDVYGETHDYLPEIAGSSHGSFVVVWRAIGPYGPYPRADFQVRGRALDETGAPESEIRTIDADADRNTPSSIIPDDDGFVVVWLACDDDRSLECDGRTLRAEARRLTADGDIASDASVVSTYAGGRVVSHHIGRMPNGGFVVAWAGYGGPSPIDGDPTPFDTLVMRLDGELRQRTQVYRLASENEVWSTQPKVVADDEGGVLVVWAATQDGASDILARYRPPRTIP